MGDVKNLESYAIIGFDGSAIRGLKVHPDSEHIVYPMGNKVCIQEWKTKKMYFLSGHSNSVSTVAISPKGTFVGSGQINHIGFKASAKVWDFKKKIQVGSHELHKVRVESLTFSSDERYMISLGGRDDGCVVLWDCFAESATGTAAATRLTTGDAVTLTALNLRVNSFVTGGDSNLRVWNIRAESKNLDVVDVALDYPTSVSSRTGDMIKFSINYPADPTASVNMCKPALIGCLAKCGPWKKGKRPESVCYSQGIESILIMDDGCLIVGGGDGTIDILDEINWKGSFPKGKVLDPNMPYFKAVIKINEIGRQYNFLGIDGVSQPSRQQASPASWGMSGVFATAGSGDVRVWCLETCQELLRIVVPNFTCSTVLFSGDGKSIVSAWNDGNIRAFTPLTGRLMYVIFNTHNKGTSALDMTDDGKTLISGGCEGQVRVWDIRPERQTLKKVLKEHKSPVSAIQVSLSRRQVMYANTLFMCVCFEPQGCQLLTGGSDRRVAYWETGSGNLARELEASKIGAVNGLHITRNGDLFVTGGNDQMVKLWKYQEGIYTHMGLGHAGAVTCCRFSPDARYIVSTCAAGSIIVWKVPEQYIRKDPPPAPTTPQAAETSAKTLQEELRLPLAEKTAQKAAGDRPYVPSAPNKTEKIEAMDTTRGSVHSTCCPCDSARTNNSKASDKPKPTPTGTKCCRPPGSNKTDNLPTRTTSKEYVCGSGDNKK
ncbi:hypothetical protein SFRURICE_009183 [Spodoptera frugiperda]|nr:hypothetical protein SFRURICE_009183 [Spodoptera frugiperda]